MSIEPHGVCAFDLMWWTQSHKVLDFGLWSGLGLDRVGSSPLYQAKIPKSLQELRCWQSNNPTECVVGKDFLILDHFIAQNHRNRVKIVWSWKFIRKQPHCNIVCRFHGGTRIFWSFFLFLFGFLTPKLSENRGNFRQLLQKQVTLMMHRKMENPKLQLN